MKKLLATAAVVATMITSAPAMADHNRSNTGDILGAVIGIAILADVLNNNNDRDRGHSRYDDRDHYHSHGGHHDVRFTNSYRRSHNDRGSYNPRRTCYTTADRSHFGIRKEINCYGNTIWAEPIHRGH